MLAMKPLGYRRDGRPIWPIAGATNTFGITARAYRWYNDDGSETTATAAAAENAAVTLNAIADINVVLRYGVQESGAGSASGATTDDYQLQYKLNAGSFTNVTTSSTVVKAFNSANLTDTGATTSRLSAGTGSFVAGKVSEDGLLDDWQLTANNYSDLVYTVTVLAAGVVDGDSLTFRVLRNGSVFDTYSQTPTITVQSRASLSHTVANITFTGGTHTTTKAMKLSSTVANITFTGGSHTLTYTPLPNPKPVSSVGRRVFGASAPYVDEIGDRVFGSTTGRDEVGTFVSNLPSSGFTDYTLSSTVANVTFGATSPTVTKAMKLASVVANITFTGTTDSLLKAMKLSSTVANITFGATSPTITKTMHLVETAANLSFNATSPTPTKTMHLSDTVANVTFTGGSHSMSVGRALSSTVANISFNATSPSAAKTMHSTSVVANITFSGTTDATTIAMNLAHAVANIAFQGGDHTMTAGSAGHTTLTSTVANISFGDSSPSITKAMTLTSTVANITFGATSPTPTKAMNLAETSGAITFNATTPTTALTRYLAATFGTISFVGGDHILQGPTNHVTLTAEVANITFLGGEDGFLVVSPEVESGSVFYRPGIKRNPLLGQKPEPPRKVKIHVPTDYTLVPGSGRVSFTGGNHTMDYQEDLGLLILL